MIVDNANRMLLVRNVAYWGETKLKDQFTTVHEFVLHNFDYTFFATAAEAIAEINKFERIVLKEKGTYRLDVSIDCCYDVSLAD